MSDIDASGSNTELGPSVYDRLEAAEFFDDPFPHFILHDALPAYAYKALAESFPCAEQVAADQELENNRPYLKAATAVLADPQTPDIWRHFFERHLRPDIFWRIVDRWGPTIEQIHPRRCENFGKALADFETGVRQPGKWNQQANREVDLVLDCLFGINTPVREVSPARGPHVDSPAKLFSSLLYFRDPEDDCRGGEFELYRLRGGMYPKRDYKAIPDSWVERVKTVPYRANTLVGWLNGAEAIHAVSPRSLTKRCRRYIAITGECYGGRDRRGHFLHHPEWETLLPRLRDLVGF